jgi:hypothetical protein
MLLFASDLNKAQGRNRTCFGSSHYSHTPKRLDKRGKKWLIDSGASAHMTSCQDVMECYKLISISRISIGDKSKLQMIGKRNVKLAIMGDGNLMKCTIENALHAPCLEHNLLSAGTMKSKGMTASFGGGLCSIFAASKKPAQGTRAGTVYILGVAANISVARPLFRRGRCMLDLFNPTFGVLRT